MQNSPTEQATAEAGAIAADEAAAKVPAVMAFLEEQFPRLGEGEV